MASTVATSAAETASQRHPHRHQHHRPSPSYHHHHHHHHHNPYPPPPLHSRNTHHPGPLPSYIPTPPPPPLHPATSNSSIWTLVDSTRIPSDAVLPPLRGIQLLVDAANVATAKETTTATATKSKSKSKAVATNDAHPAHDTLQRRASHRRAAAPVPGSLSERQNEDGLDIDADALGNASLHAAGTRRKGNKDVYVEDQDEEDQEDDDDDDEFIPPVSTASTTLASRSKPSANALIEDTRKTPSSATKKASTTTTKASSSASTATTATAAAAGGDKKCPCRPRSRKTSHSVIERRRRQKINERLIHLQCSVPACREEAELLLRSRTGKGGIIPSSSSVGTRKGSGGTGRKGSGAAVAGGNGMSEKEAQAVQAQMIRTKLESALVVEKLCVISHTVDYVAELEARLAMYRDAFARAGIPEPKLPARPADSHTCSAHTHAHELIDDEDEEEAESGPAADQQGKALLAPAEVGDEVEGGGDGVVCAIHGKEGSTVASATAEAGKSSGGNGFHRKRKRQGSDADSAISASSSSSSSSISSIRNADPAGAAVSPLSSPTLGATATATLPTATVTLTVTLRGAVAVRWGCATR
ncbi:hypothetical protein V8E36_008402 [Tilletia maclaganii]